MIADVFLDSNILLSAVTLRRRYRLSHWDSVILAAASELGCHTLYSEDFSDDQNFDCVRVINPFR